MATSAMKACIYCYIKDGVKICSRCKKARYCSIACQKKHWKIHKVGCQAPPETKELDELTSDEFNLEDPIMTLKSMSEFVKLSTIKKSQTLKIAKFVEEYSRKYPTEKKQHEMLLEYYLEQTLWSSYDISVEDMNHTETTLLKRYGALSPELFEFLNADLKPGDIFYRAEIISYEPRIYQTMKSLPVLTLDCERDKTYIFIAFVDMHQMMKSKLANGEGKVTFIGYERSEVCIARSIILYQMMKSGCDPTSILQVWFSTGWSDKTSLEFKNCCKLVLENKNLPRYVKKLIKHWYKENLSLSAATEIWHNTCPTTGESTPIGNLKSKNDRLSYCRYMLTGQCFDTLNHTCGNVSMFCLIERIDSCQMADQNYLNFLSFYEQPPYGKQFFESVERRLIKSLKIFIENISAGIISCEFRLAEVSLQNKEIIAEINSLHPYYIDWSNLADYLSNAEFLELTKACGVRATTHVAYFVNWSRFVFGTFVLDYTTSDKRRDVYKDCGKKFKVEFDKLHASGLIPYLRKDGIVINPWNMTENVLSNELKHYFLDYYFGIGNVDVKIIDKDSFCNIFARIGSIICVEFNF